MRTNKYTVRQNTCGCHPQTCCCDDWAIFTETGEKFLTLGSKPLADVMAENYNLRSRETELQAKVEAKVEALRKDAEWQPIETAPKETDVFIGRFIDGEFKFGRSELFYEQANEFAGETFSGWVWSEDECSSSITELPTHWMPLPNPPIEGEIT